MPMESCWPNLIQKLVIDFFYFSLRNRINTLVNKNSSLLGPKKTWVSRLNKIREYEKLKRIPPEWKTQDYMNDMNHQSLTYENDPCENLVSSSIKAPSPFNSVLSQLNSTNYKIYLSLILFLWNNVWRTELTSNKELK